MLSFDEAGAILDEAVDALPEGIYDDLNGGVNLLPESRRGEDGRYIMGLYHHDGMGRYVEIFYGSFVEVYGSGSDEVFAEELKKTLRHELTHHVENKAGDRTLERWDEEQALKWAMSGEPLEADSVLFADEDAGEKLAAEADRLFREALPEVRSGFTALSDATEELLASYDAVLCMTLEQAEALAGRFPQFNEKILCLGEKDILPPLRRAQRQLRREIRYLVAELTAEAEE